MLLGTYIVAAEVERRKLDKLDPPPAKMPDEKEKASITADGRKAPVFFPPAREKEPTKVSK
ncbi:MAG: hypothetical protein MUO36_02515 [Candidatus Hadarchaeum sp.]|nr:hypothetical protein [Candidatus Hadarchaeum sp.]